MTDPKDTSEWPGPLPCTAAQFERCQPEHLGEALWPWLIPAMDEPDLRSVPRPFLLLGSAWWIYCDAGNGGLEQYVCNCSYDIGLAAEALEEMKRPEAASILREALLLFPDPKMKSDRYARCGLLEEEAGSNDFLEMLSKSPTMRSVAALTGAFWTAIRDSDFEGDFGRYAKSHRDAFAAFFLRARFEH